MYEFKSRYNIKVIAYCIMSNHAHILINTDLITNMSGFMHSLNTSYACYYNKKYQRVGYVFKDRYKSEGIYNERHLYNCIKYIYNNPVKAGICEKPAEYPYSNYKFKYKKIENRELEKKYLDGKCTFIDIEEDKKEVFDRAMVNFLLENNLNINDLRKSKKTLHELVVSLKRDYKISLREMSEYLKMDRETIRKIYNKQ